MTKSIMSAKVVPALLAAGLGLCCAGCATISLWEKTEKVEVEIHDARVTTTNGVAQTVVIIGRKQPFFWFSTEGEVDSFDVFAQRNERQTYCVSSDCPVVTNATCRLPLVEETTWPKFDSRCPEGVFLVWNESRFMRTSLAVPIRSKPDSSSLESRQESVIVLDRPYIFQGREFFKPSPTKPFCYTHEELGVRGVVQRVLFVPVTVCVDIITLPVALVVGPFMKMCN